MAIKRGDWVFMNDLARAEFALSLARAGFKVRSTFRLGAAGWRAAGEEDEVGVDWRFRRYVVRGVLAKTHPFVSRSFLCE